MRLTDQAFWDVFWTKRSQLKAIGRFHQVFGERGWFLRSIPDLREKRVVEFGGAGSYFLLALAKWRDARVTAVDYSDGGLRLTRSLFSLNGVPVDLVHADVFDWNPAAPFDAVVHFGLLEHFVDPVPLLLKSRQVVRDDGIVVFTMPNMDAAGAHFWRTFAPGNWEKHAYHSDGAVRSACIQADLRLERVCHFGGPLIQIAPWEIAHPLLPAVTLAQKAINLLGSPFYHLGHRKFSSIRGFIARPM